MHVFEINRSQSATELWKGFEYSPSDCPKTSEAKPDVTQPSEVASHDAAPNKASASVSDDAFSTTPASRGETQSLLAAFEAELGQWLSSAETSGAQTRQPESSPAAEPSSHQDPHKFPPAIEALVTQIVQYLRSGVNIVQSEVRTRIPELRHHLEEAQRELPENLAASLQALVAQLDAKMRDFAHGHLPEHGRQMAEEALNAGRPIAESAVGSLWTISSELEQAGRTLYAAFEHELRRNMPHATGVATGGPSGAPSGAPDHMNLNQASSGPTFGATEPGSVGRPLHTEGPAVPPVAPQGFQQFPSSHEIPSNPVYSGQYTQAGPSFHGWPQPPSQDWPYIPAQHLPPYLSTSQTTPLSPQVPGNAAWHMNPTTNVHDSAKSHHPHCPASSDTPSDKPQEATEHHSGPPQARHSTATDTWARLDGRERRRARQTSSLGADITSNPNEDAQHTQTSRPETNADQATETDIEKCISSLANMGFGSPEQGGRSRLAVYAAAANGSVYDAVELIEDERKYYATMD